MDFASAKYNMPERPTIFNDDAGAANGAITTRDSNTATLGPDNPALWLLLIGGITIGLIGISTHARVGNVSAGFDAGDT